MKFNPAMSHCVWNARGGGTAGAGAGGAVAAFFANAASARINRTSIIVGRFDRKSMKGLQPLARNQAATLPAQWKLRTFKDKGFRYLWNTSADVKGWLGGDPKRFRAAGASRQTITTAREPMCFCSQTTRVTPSSRKYANASCVRVSVAQQNGAACVEVADDGDGGADPALGSGLRGLADRLAALNGTLEVESPPGKGTTIRAEIPLRVG